MRPLCLDCMCFQVVQPAVQLKKPHVLWQSDGSLWMLLLCCWQATFEDSLADEAVAKKHCTTSEAVEVGAQAGAYRTLLTHFSQRYPKIPVVDQNFQVRGGF